MLRKIALMVLCGSSVIADTHYVDLNSSSPTSPYTTWATAATNIQDAVNVALSNSTVIVTNGTYFISSEIVVNKTLTIQSVNGFESTIVDGNQQSRCFNLYDHEITISGFTIQNSKGSGGGGGVYCYTTTPVVSNCVIRNNSARDGGGMYRGTVNNCTFFKNSASDDGGGMYQGIANNCIFNSNSARDKGGGVFYGMVNNCRFIANSTSYNASSVGGGGMYGGTANNSLFTENSTASQYGGGMYGGTASNCTFTANSTSRNTPLHGGYGGGMYNGAVANCILWYNKPNDLSSATAQYSCSPNVTHGIDGNITNAPVIISSYHIASNSPCRGAGNPAYTFGADLDGQPWLNPPSMGCDEYYDETVDERPIYVSKLGNDSNDGRSWATAKVSIQAGVDAQLHPFGRVIVGDGTYILESAITVDKAVEIQSENGSEAAIVDGNQQTTCFDLKFYENRVIGFTIQNGDNNNNGGGVYCSGLPPVVSNCVIRSNSASNGGGMYDGTANDCIFSSNSAVGAGGGMYGGIANNCDFFENSGSFYPSSIYVGGGGMYYGTANNCTFSGNSGAYGGGMRYGTATDCTISNNYSSTGGGGLYGVSGSHCMIIDNYSSEDGGGACSGTLDDSVIKGNVALFGDGGGIYSGTANNCKIIENSAGGNGGGVYGSTLKNCEINDNYSEYDGGGIHNGTAYNCTLIDNYAENDGSTISIGKVYNSIIYFDQYAPLGNMFGEGASVVFSCAPLLRHGGQGNITNAPQFVATSDGNYRLGINSPCINAGLNFEVQTETDGDGNPRIVFGAVDMGAYEYQGADYVADNDNDGLTNVEELHYGTNPNNPDSDSDGFDDGVEVSSGLNPLLPDSWIPDYVVANGETFGLYPSNVVLDVAVGQMLLTTINGEVQLSLQLEQAVDLVNDSWTNSGDAVEWVLPVDPDKQFFRVRSSPVD